jgi:predicted heme/steroid binding protein/quinol monooxygenase YgiN
MIDKAKAQKILRSLPFEEGFHFAVDLNKYTSETALNLFSFYEELKTIEPESLRFHFQRRDFQKWIETTLDDQELALRIDKLPKQLNDEELREELIKTLQVRITELQTANLSNKSTPEVNAKKSFGELKKFKAKEIEQYSGQAGNPSYLIFESKVYDVSDSKLWQGGNHRGVHQAGKDLTEAIKSAPHGKEVLSKVKQVGVVA